MSYFEHHVRFKVVSLDINTQRSLPISFKIVIMYRTMLLK